MIDPVESALCALYCYEAECVGPITMAMGAAGPALPAWMMKDHDLIGWLTGQDTVLSWLDLDERRVFYAYVMESERGLTIAIRGTQSFAEWAIDAEGIPEPAPLPAEGSVETGFWSLSKTLRFRSAGTDQPLTAIFDSHWSGPILVTGHSLGAAEATLVALALAEIKETTVRGRFIASPHPGDAKFAAYFASQVSDYAVYAYERDLVPKVPAGLGYVSLDNLIMLPANARIANNLADNHHAGNYAWLIDPVTTIMWAPDAPRLLPRSATASAAPPPTATPTS
jgi:hypothetical protein